MREKMGNSGAQDNTPGKNITVVAIGHFCQEEPAKGTVRLGHISMPIPHSGRGQALHATQGTKCHSYQLAMHGTSNQAHRSAG
jgi:hypothetical protein